MMDETQENRLRRMTMRSMRRGIKEMDLILGSFARDALETLSEPELDRYDALLSENDHDLYQWVSGQGPTPSEYGDLISRISAHAEGVATRI